MCITLYDNIVRHRVQCSVWRRRSLPCVVWFHFSLASCANSPWPDGHWKSIDRKAIRRDEDGAAHVRGESAWLVCMLSGCK